MTTWNEGYAAGQHRGQLDGRAELDSRYTRNPDHDGTAAAGGPEWVDGFLDGYSHGRDDEMRGAA